MTSPLRRNPCTAEASPTLEEALFQLTAEQRADLIAFLQSLTDEALLRDPRFANPWTAARAQ